MDILQSVMESSSHAMFTLDRNGIITRINRQAKERFGLVNCSSHFHKSGKLEKGDIVIIADNSMGEDDGRLTGDDLKRLGVKENEIGLGDVFAVIGKYDWPKSKPIYKVRPKNSEALQLSAEYEGVSVRCEIGNGEIKVTVDGVCYVITYFMHISQMVVLDGKTHEVKFWQERGFSARKEGVGNLLRGDSFAEKTPEQEIIVAGHHFSEFFEGKLFEEHVRQVITGEVERYEDVEYEINGFALVASITPFNEGERIGGVVIRFRRIEDIKTTIIERNEIIKLAEKKYHDIRQSSILEDSAFTALFGNSTAMSSVRRYAYKLSQLDCNILITGESGTGKSRMARAIYSSQPRKGQLIVVDCSTISPTLFESEMFGYVGGAFTGANTKGKAGFFEAADGGTIFLDEIGEIPLGIQAKLLNVIQNKVICRVGSTKTIPVDVRIIAATNRDLKAEMAAGRFRSDLYYRISAFSLELPALRDCKEDIFFIVDSLMDNIREKYNMPEKYLSGEVFTKLMNYDWPGNIRELENVLERAAALSDTDIIYPEHILIENPEPSLTLKERLKAEEKRIIKETLIQFEDNKNKAMKQLGLSKTTFYEKLKEFNL